MNRIGKISLLLWLFLLTDLHASYKVYLVHGYGGVGLELGKIYKAIQNAGYDCEIFYYPSLLKEVDSVGKVLFNKIQQEKRDSVSFVTHSMGGLVVRTLYNYLKPGVKFPYIHRIVMIAPPNKGSPVADSLIRYDLIKFLAGPNLQNLTTDTLHGAPKYPVPTCEVGIVIGNKTKKRCYMVPLQGENDGVVLTKDATLGTEKDVVYVEATHIRLLFKNRVSACVVNFLRKGTFE